MDARNTAACLVGTQPLSEWLARAHPEPAHAYTEWYRHGVAMLPLGKAFVAARLSRELVSAAVGATDPQDIAVILGKLIDGPVICDDQKMGGTYYVLMAAQSEPAWAHQAIAPLLVHGTYLGVPRLNRHGPPGSYWAVAPRCTGDLSTPQCVAGLVALGHERLAIGDEQ